VNISWREAARRGIRVYLMAGKLDPLAPKSRQAIQELRSAGVKCQYVEFEHTGHEPPPDYEAQQRRAIEFLTVRADD
jgi:predicted esterase